MAVSRMLSEPIDNILKQMEDKMYENLINLSKSLNELLHINEQYNIISNIWVQTMIKLNNVNNKQQEIMNYLIENHNQAFIDAKKEFNNLF